jgi:apolipoprotein N-acyltransferase
MVSEEDITLQKYSNYHSAYLLLLLSWVAIPPWLSINYDQMVAMLSSLIIMKVIGIVLLISLFTLSLTVLWNRCIETESALKSKCKCS